MRRRERDGHGEHHGDGERHPRALRERGGSLDARAFGKRVVQLVETVGRGGGGDDDERGSPAGGRGVPSEGPDGASNDTTRFRTESDIGACPGGASTRRDVRADDRMGRGYARENATRSFRHRYRAAAQTRAVRLMMRLGVFRGGDRRRVRGASRDGGHRVDVPRVGRPRWV